MLRDGDGRNGVGAEAPLTGVGDKRGREIVSPCAPWHAKQTTHSTRSHPTMMELLTELNQRGRTIVIITHSMWAAASYAHRSVVMADGKIIADGPTRKVFSDRDALAQASLEPTATVGLSQSLWGVTLLSPEEFKAVATTGGAP